MNRAFRTILSALIYGKVAFCFTQYASASVKKSIPKVILDSDFSGNCDDAGALAMLHVLADKKELEIMGVVTSLPDPWNTAAIWAVNKYYLRPNLPIGAIDAPDRTFGEYSHKIAVKYASSFKKEEHVIDSVKLYYQLLSQANDRSVTIISIGFFSNLAKLLQRYPSLVAAKVEKLVSMAGRFPSGLESNIYRYGLADAKFSLENWPTPVFFAGYGLRVKIRLNSKLMRGSPKENPVRFCYKELIKNDSFKYGWDQNAVLFAARGHLGRWELSEPGQIEVLSDGSNIWTDKSDRQFYLKPNNEPKIIEDEIMNLMATPPKDFGS